MHSKSILKFIYANSYEDALVKGKKMFTTSNVVLLEKDTSNYSVTIKVKDDAYEFYYKVTIRNYDDIRRLFIRCNCNSKSHYLCKHKIASLFLLNTIIDKEIISNVENKIYNQKHTIVSMKIIDVRRLKTYSTEEIFQNAQNELTKSKVKILESSNGKVLGEYKNTLNEVHQITLFFNVNKEFETSCTCTEDSAPLCTHKLMLFLQILGKYGINYFLENRDKEAEKELLMDYYNENQNDNSSKNVLEFEDDGSKLKLKIIKSENAVLTKEQLNNLANNINLPSTSLYGILFNTSINSFPFFKIDLLTKDKTGINKLELENKNILSFINKNDKEILKEFIKINFTETLKSFYKTSFSINQEKNIVYYNTEDIPAQLKNFTYSYYIKLIKKLHQQQFYKISTFYSDKKSNDYNQLTQINIFHSTISPIIKITNENNLIVFKIFVNIENELIPIEKNNLGSNILFLYNQNLYIWGNENIENLFNTIEKLQKQTIKSKDWNIIFQTNILSFLDLYQFNFDPKLTDVQEKDSSKKILIVKESENYLQFSLQFIYNDIPVDYNKSNHLLYIDEKTKKSILIKRNKKTEDETFNFIVNLSVNWEIIETENNEFKFLIQKKTALENKWFLILLEKIKENDIVIGGIEFLKNFSPIEKKPKVNIEVKSGIDWLDVEMKIEIDNEEISIEDLSLMLKSENNIIHLSNNKVVSISKDWIKKYKVLFDLAEKQNNNTLKLQNSQIGIIQYIEKEENQDYLNINWNNRVNELSIPKDKTIILPFGLNSILRNFQLQSVLWADNLIDNKCNGLLSDDMGLGKTLQALSILSLYKEKNKQLFALVVCPTSLTHTWSQEITKFTPELTFTFFHGNDRKIIIDKKNKTNIIITTYGTLRNDFNTFKPHNFDYIVLDESQNIKNPQSKTYQALLKISSKHKLCLSGTPLQNNTIDIFAQMSFLNHGMFGSLNWFKNQFSTPIDKFNDFEIKNMLRKILQPLILRRTKEEVSPELPEKTISTIYCEMEDEQKKIYESYKNEFRNDLLGKIQKNGLNKTKMHILKALLILRQICNTPQLVKSEFIYPDVSIKRDILVEQIIDNAQNHKILIFSQFLGMLSLIKKSLIKNNISFEYLDGSLTPSERKKAVDNFQNNNEIKIFLISLKAGGLGLTLTSADYVYIIDPWWNPTIEAQAIDRTHRIGQTKKIIANKLICKNTVEEKIILLQQKKISLTNDIIENEETLLKNITEDDVDFLLS